MLFILYNNYYLNLYFRHMNRRITLTESKLKDIINEVVNEAIAHRTKTPLNEANPFNAFSKNNINTSLGGAIRLIHDIQDTLREQRYDEAMYQLENLEKFVLRLKESEKRGIRNI